MRHGHDQPTRLRNQEPSTLPSLEAFIAFLPVADLSATHHFYGELLGLPLALDQGTCRIYRVAGGGYVGFCERDDASPAPGVIVTLVTTEVDVWYDRLQATGIQTDGPPRYNERYGIYHFFASDPDGWSVEVQCFEDPLEVPSRAARNV